MDGEAVRGAERYRGGFLRGGQISDQFSINFQIFIRAPKLAPFFSENWLNPDEVLKMRGLQGSSGAPAGVGTKHEQKVSSIFNQFSINYFSGTWQFSDNSLKIIEKIILFRGCKSLKRWYNPCNDYAIIRLDNHNAGRDPGRRRILCLPS